MPMKGIGEKTQQAAVGLQELLRVDAAPAADKAKEGQLGVSAGALAVQGNYDFWVDCAGCADVEIHVRSSALSGTVTPSAFTTYADGSTSKTALTDSGAGALVNATRRTFSISGLTGERKVVLRLAVSGSSSVTLDQCEANAA